MSAKTEITHDALLQRDHSDMIVYETIQITPSLSGDWFFTFWTRLVQTLNDNQTLKVPSGWDDQNDLGLKSFYSVSVDQCFYLWISIPAVLYFVNVLFLFLRTNWSVWCLSLT